jgi:hypothetical protein
VSSHAKARRGRSRFPAQEGAGTAETSVGSESRRNVSASRHRRYSRILGRGGPRAPVGLGLVIAILVAGGLAAMAAPSLPSLAVPRGLTKSTPAGATEPSPTASGELVDRYVSDLRFLKADNGLGPVERDRANGGPATGDGGALTMAGVDYRKGLGVYPYSEVRVSLGGWCRRLSATVGVDDRVVPGRDRRRTEVVFVVRADGEEVYRSQPLLRSDPPVGIDVDVSGVKRLDLIVHGLGFTIGDYADWGNARLSCRAPVGDQA